VILRPCLPEAAPDGCLFLWSRTPVDGTVTFARRPLPALQRDRASRHLHGGEIRRVSIPDPDSSPLRWWPTMRQVSEAGPPYRPMVASDDAARPTTAARLSSPRQLKRNVSMSIDTSSSRLGHDAHRSPPSTAPSACQRGRSGAAELDSGRRCRREIDARGACTIGCKRRPSVVPPAHNVRDGRVGRPAAPSTSRLQVLTFDAEQFSWRRGCGSAAGRGAAVRLQIARNVVLMPSFVNIGALIERGYDGHTWPPRVVRADRPQSVHLVRCVGIGRRAGVRCRAARP